MQTSENMFHISSDHLQRSDACNCFYCRIKLEALLCDAKRDLLTIAKLLVITASSVECEPCHFYFYDE